MKNIDILAMKLGDPDLLSRLFNQHKAVYLFFPKQKYSIIDGSNQAQDIRLSHALLRLNLPNRPLSYLVIGPEIGVGTTGRVHAICGSIRPAPISSSALTVYPEHQMRVLKVQDILNAEQRELYKKETMALRFATHLKATSLHLVNHRLAFIVMNRMPGEELFDFMDRDFKNRFLTNRDRLLLTKAMLRAYYTQVYQKNLVHRDIKPENILVLKTSNGLFMVNFIDFAFAKIGIATNDSIEHKGSPDYASPEAVLDEPTNTSSDLYAIGIILALLWRANTKAQLLPHIDLSIPKHLQRITQKPDRVFYAIELTASKTLEKHITTLLTGLCRGKIDERISLQQAMNLVDECLSTFFPESMALPITPPPEHKMSKRERKESKQQTVKHRDRGGETTNRYTSIYHMQKSPYQELLESALTCYKKNASPPHKQKTVRSVEAFMARRSEPTAKQVVHMLADCQDYHLSLRSDSFACIFLSNMAKACRGASVLSYLHLDRAIARGLTESTDQSCWATLFCCWNSPTLIPREVLQIKLERYTNNQYTLSSPLLDRVP